MRHVEEGEHSLKFQVPSPYGLGETVFKEPALRPILSSIYLSVCPLPMQFLFGPLIGPQIT